MSVDKFFTKENLDVCLSQLAKEYRKLNRTKVPAEIVLVGGAAVLVNYGFRNMTYDIDAIIQASSAMQMAISRAGDKLEVPVGWINADFMRTSSYSPKLIEFSEYYKTFSNVLTVRTVAREYLVAMKLVSCRTYKNDISDIVGILYEEQLRGVSLSLDDIMTAVENLYGSWDVLTDTSKNLIKDILDRQQFESLYKECLDHERAAKETLIVFDIDYPNVVNHDNVNSILQMLMQRKK